ncbi:MAG: SLC13/DASS family transporter [Paludibacteraceae bacterium]|nr:SLC13/DASS family transporter [Paludibacteraceae bacterium]
MSIRKTTGLVVAIVAALIALFLPSEFYHIDGLTVIHQRVIAIFVLGAFLWVSEAIPIWATSVMVIVLMLLSISNSAFAPFRYGIPAEELISYKHIMSTFADPTIMLFLGGFVLAIAAQKCQLDNNLARVLLKPFGTKSQMVLLGFLLITAVFSMFMSNTATAAMMITILAPIIKATQTCRGKGKIALAMSIPIAANVGGIGTPVGTPPNAIALKYLNDPEGLNLGIGFGQWSALMIPFVIVLLLFTWLLLRRLFPFEEKNIIIHIDGKFRKDWHAVVTYVTFGVTVLLWMLDKVTGINANAVALIPVAVFCATGIINRDDLKEIPWSVLWLVAGGFALGVGLEDTGLAKQMIDSIPFGDWNPVVTIIGAGVICLLMSTFISNSATAALLIPILAAIGKGMGETLTPFGGIVVLLSGIALSASLAMSLPISTPPNAIAYSTGIVNQKDMAKVGITVGVVGLALGYALLMTVGKYIL